MCVCVCARACVRVCVQGGANRREQRIQGGVCKIQSTRAQACPQQGVRAVLCVASPNGQLDSRETARSFPTEQTFPSLMVTAHPGSEQCRCCTLRVHWAGGPWSSIGACGCRTLRAVFTTAGLLAVRKKDDDGAGRPSGECVCVLIRMRISHKSWLVQRVGPVFRSGPFIETAAWRSHAAAGGGGVGVGDGTGLSLSRTVLGLHHSESAIPSSDSESA
jgi:hypothetical protein